MNSSWFKKGQTSIRKGIIMSDEQKNKLSLSHKGMHNSLNTEFKKGQPVWNKGKPLSEAHRIKLSLSHQHKNEFDGFQATRMHQLKSSLEYKNWRTKVFTRDEFTCQNCKKVGGYLEAHHIQSKRDFLELMFDINNGITYCRECHAMLDTVRGNKRNKKQNNGGN